MHNIPIRLVYEGFATSFTPSPDLIAIAIDPTVTNVMLITQLANADWGVDIAPEIKAKARRDVIGNRWLETPFLELAPEDPPEQWNVRPHPIIKSMWLVIDPEIDIDSSWACREQAVYAAWCGASERDQVEALPQHRALFRITLDAPPGYVVRRLCGQWSWQISGRGNYAMHSELIAKIDAWNHYLAVTQAHPGFKAGEIEGPNECEKWTAEIDHVYPDHTWRAQIEVHGNSEAEATELRDRVLAFLRGEPR